MSERVWNGNYNKRGDMRGCIIMHGKSKTRLYSIWCDMKRRCYNIKNKRYENYGKRGIVVCDEWKNNFMSFYDWSMRNGYDDSLTIDRIDNDRDYLPDNCRWATQKEQMRNTTRNHFVTAFGKTKTIAEWGEMFGIKQDVIKDRLKKLHWFPEEAVSLKTLPLGGKRNVENS